MASITLPQEEAEWTVLGNSPEYKVIAETVEFLKNGDKAVMCVLEKNDSGKYFMASYVVVKETVLVGNVLLEVDKI